MIDKQTVLSLTNGGLNVFRHYFGNNISTRRKFRNPFYEDTHPSCSLYFDRQRGIYKYKDFGNEDYAGDCFDLVAKLHNLSCRNADDFIEILRIIDRELNLGIADTPPAIHSRILPQPSEPTPEPQPPLPYKYRERSWPTKELEYWQQYGIDAKTLQRYGVISLTEYSGISNAGRTFTLRSSPSEPMFGYTRPDGIKVYRPKSKFRFLFGGRIKGNYNFGLEQLPAAGDTLYITGGEKDVLSLSAHGFPAICFGSETTRIPHELIDKLSRRFGQIVLLYDMDETGRKCSQALQEELRAYNVRRVELPLAGTKPEKDISDFFRLGHTAEELRRITASRPTLKHYPSKITPKPKQH